MASIIQIRRDTAANWTSANPILAQGELGIETDTLKVKAGNGSTAWASLSYLIDTGGYVTITGAQTLTNKTLTSPVINTPTGIVKGDVGLGNVDNTSDATKNSASVTLTNKTLTNPTVNDYVESVVVIGTVTSASTLSLTSGTVQTATLTASTACTFTMPTATAGKSFVLLLKQAASTGGGTATFTGVKWNTASAPTITATAGKMDILTFIADGTNWYGSIAQGYTP
jgi:hypothetical protein